MCGNFTLMTLTVTKTDENEARISQQAYASEWALVIQADQIDNIIYQLKAVQEEINKAD